MKPVAIGAIAALLCNVPLHDVKMLEASSLMNQGAAAGQTGDFSTSIAWLTRAVQVEPEMPEVHFNLGRAFLLSGRYSEAVSELQQAQRLAPDLVMVDFQLAQCFEQLGNRSGAIAHYRRASELEPNDPRPGAALSRLLQSN